ncbi:hypothetical protein FHR32_003709 [Streptosporangium album]|uniref:Uncharacterized protein n=1 Tax=Streptosporangium album TaxID=47479 RepID=A0A7W7WAR1_9ACTN|nr:hypothetical protein [Streptosporangium album]MBB4939404.1 hypothetical protein [Streptosporangium album]
MTLASAEDIHAYLADRLNLALRRPGMMGGEIGITLLMDPLFVAERQPEGWPAMQRDLARRGVWSARGVTGAFAHLLPAHGATGHVEETASVYAELAQPRGWLRPDRVLTTDEYANLRRTMIDWVASDRTWTDVTSEYGQPSMLFGGTNPLYSKTLGYMSNEPNEPMVAFHLWNGPEPGTDTTWPSAHPEPLLIAIRLGLGQLAETLTYTPTGHRLRPTNATAEI